MTPHLQIRRVTVHRQGRSLYSNSFHPGVNIIHGDNGSGKSTIMDFIFFGLGGDLKEWRPEAQLADDVMIEVSAGDTTLTTRREVSATAGRPMYIYFGPYDQALTAGPTEWRLCPYRRQDDNYSFSQVLFRAIGLPESVSDGSSNITMHQILRLLYADQLTPVQRIFRVENFDTWQTRQAVGDLLCGIGGYDLYSKQIELRETTQRFDALSLRLKNLLSVASSYGDKVLGEHIEAALVVANAEREKLLGTLNRLLTEETSAEATDQDADRLSKKLVRDVTRSRRTVAELEDRIATLEYEIDDANRFIRYLEQALSDFDDAALTFFSLGQVRFEFCPACFRPLETKEDGSHCHLCGSVSPPPTVESKNLAVRLDLEMQTKESGELQEQRAASLVQLKAQMRTEQANLRAASDAYELARRGHATDREQAVSETSRRVGYLESEIKILQGRLNLAAEISSLSAEKERLNSDLSRLKDTITAIEASQRQRKQVAYTEISENAKRILARDLADQSDFGMVEDVSFSFSDDWVAINGDKNRARSASGMVVLKNSFLLATYIASLADPLFGLPRFLLLDNVEDKGMVQERAWNFQHTIVAECEALPVRQQIIFATSKISPNLNKPQYVVGRKYTRENPSLEFVGRT